MAPNVRPENFVSENEKKVGNFSGNRQKKEYLCYVQGQELFGFEHLALVKEHMGLKCFRTISC